MLRAPATTASVIETPLVPSATGRLRQWLSQPDNQLLLLLLLAVFPLYYELGRTPIQLWDESRMAVNAAEMARDGHWLVPHFDGIPDHWNTKPPLLIWLEALSLRAFGLSTLALRLPTLVATMATVVLLFRFAARVLHQPLAGFFGSIVLVTCLGYVRLHVARTADYDALLTCWQALLWTQFFQYLETGARRHLVWAALAVLAGTLTKGPAGLLGLPGLLVYTIVRGKLLWLLRQPGVYVAAAGWLAIVSGYFVGREAIDPGYWRAVQDNDLGGRFLTAIEGHSASWTYYLENITTILFSQWLWAVAPAAVLIWLQPAGIVRRASWLLLLFVIGWLTVISIAKSKLEWYDAPIYPALALLVGLGLAILYQNLLSIYLPRMGYLGGWLLRIGLFITLFYGGYHTVARQLIEERHSDFGAGSNGYLGRYVTTMAHAQPQITDVLLLTDGSYYAVLQYYRMEFEQKAGRHLAFGQGKVVRKLPVGQVVISCDPAYRAALDSTFHVAELHQEGTCQTLLLLDRR